MIGMSFSAFLTLLVLGFISSVVLHLLIRYRVLAGVDGFIAKWIVGWMGAWLGTPIFGHWGVLSAGLYLVPALLGAFAAPFMVTAMFKASGMIAISPQMAVTSQPVKAPQIELRKAS